MSAHINHRFGQRIHLSGFLGALLPNTCLVSFGIIKVFWFLTLYPGYREGSGIKEMSTSLLITCSALLKNARLISFLVLKRRFCRVQRNILCLWSLLFTSSELIKQGHDFIALVDRHTLSRLERRQWDKIKKRICPRITCSTLWKKACVISLLVLKQPYCRIWCICVSTVIIAQYHQVAQLSQFGLVKRPKLFISGGQQRSVIVKRDRVRRCDHTWPSDGLSRWVMRKIGVAVLAFVLLHDPIWHSSKHKRTNDPSWQANNSVCVCFPWCIS